MGKDEIFTKTQTYAVYPEGLQNSFLGKDSIKMNCYVYIFFSVNVFFLAMSLGVFPLNLNVNDY